MPKAFINIDITPNGDGHNFSVTTDLNSQDEVNTLLLMTVENMAGVSADGYVAEIDQHRANHTAREGLAGA